MDSFPINIPFNVTAHDLNCLISSDKVTATERAIVLISSKPSIEIKT
jgi:hypothetical protein